MNTIQVWFERVIRSKMMWFSMLLAALSTLQLSLGLFTPYLSPMVYGLVCLVIAVVVAVLRVVTKSALVDK